MHLDTTFTLQVAFPSLSAKPLESCSLHLWKVIEFVIVKRCCYRTVAQTPAPPGFTGAEKEACAALRSREGRVVSPTLTGLSGGRG